MRVGFPKSVIPKAPQKLTLEEGDKQIKLKWKYPKWQGSFADLGIRYNVYRKSQRENKFQKVLNVLLLLVNEVSLPRFRIKLYSGRQLLLPKSQNWVRKSQKVSGLQLLKLSHLKVLTSLQLSKKQFNVQKLESMQ